MFKVLEKGTKQHYQLEAEKENPAAITGTSNISYEVVDVVLRPPAGDSLTLDQRATEKFNPGKGKNGPKAFTVGLQWMKVVARFIHVINGFCCTAYI
ncbi:hypothetical protein [Endozoicomonas sp. 2B-B]